MSKGDQNEKLVSRSIKFSEEGKRGYVILSDVVMAHADIHAIDPMKLMDDFLENYE